MRPDMGSGVERGSPVILQNAKEAEGGLRQNQATELTGRL